MCIISVFLNIIFLIQEGNILWSIYFCIILCVKKYPLHVKNIVLYTKHTVLFLHMKNEHDIL
jgi:hypothetical protein